MADAPGGRPRRRPAPIRRARSGGDPVTGSHRASASLRGAPGPRSPSHTRDGGPRRGPILAVLVALAVVGGLVDGAAGGARPAAAVTAAGEPVAAPPGAVSSAWYCAGATDSANGQAPGRVVVSNPGPAALTARVTVLASNGHHVAPQVLTVAPRSQASVAEAVPGGSPWAGAKVVVGGGGAAVSQEVSGSLGTASSPCAVQGSSDWYFPTGTTLRDATDTISLLNPFPADAIVNLSFVTDHGAEAPEAYQAVLVPADSLAEVNLGDHLRRRQTIATTVSASSGQVVAWQTQLVTAPAPGTPVLGEPAPAGYTGLLDPAPPTGGVQLTLGAPAASRSWRWPDGMAGGGVNEQYVVYNPGSSAAQLRLTFGIPGGAQQPLGFTVGPGSVRAIVTSAQAEVPRGRPHDATLISTNGVAVVAERTVTAVAPASRTGMGALLGATTTSRRWVVGAVAAPAARVDEWVDIQNPGLVAARVTLDQVTPAGDVPVPGVTPFQVGAGERVSVDIGSRLRSGPTPTMVVGSSSPVVVERDLYGSGGPGISLSMAVPLG